MNRDEALKWVFSKSQNITEAKESWAWVQQFIDEDTTKKERDREQIKLREQQLSSILGKPIDDPDFHVDPNQLPLAWDEPPKRTRKNSTAKKNGRKILPEETEYVARKLPTIKTEEEFNAMANELGRSPGAINEWINRAYVEIDHLRLPPAIFPKLYRRALKAAKEKAKAEANG
jgi:hypothetical protein